MKEHIENRFSDILYKSLPLILFSYEKYRKPLIEKIANLYDALDSNNASLFNELYSKIESMIKDREDFDSHKERLIDSFVNREKSYMEIIKDHNQRLRILEKKFSKLSSEKQKSIIEDKTKKPESVTIKHKDDTTFKVKYKTKTPKKVGAIDCPICDFHLTKAGKDSYGLTKLFCDNSKNRPGCGKYFPVDSNGKFLICEKCGGILTMGGKKKLCMKCRHTQTIDPSKL